MPGAAFESAGLAVQGMLVLSLAVLHHLKPIRGIAPVLFGDVVALLALGAGKRDLWTDVLPLLGHDQFPSV